MDTIILLVLLAIIVSQSVLLYFVLSKHGEEKKVLLDQLKDLTDKVYFTKTNDFISNKILEDTPKEQPKKKEEEMVPLENVDVKDLAEAYGIEVK